MRRFAFGSICLLLLAGGVALCGRAPSSHAELTTCLRPRLVVSKRAGKVVLRCAGRVRLSAYASFGAAPKGHKRQSGDERTPEGRYRICEKHRSARHYKFLGISYPGPADARRARAQKRISRAQQRAIERAFERRRCPPWNTKLGGAIGIHGIAPKLAWAARIWQRFSRATRLHRVHGLTDGCIAVDNVHVDVLFRLVPVGTPIDIRR